jgi:CheY-like chemotaxis protein
MELGMPRMALVVDDSMLIRHTVCRFLEARGFAVDSARNGRDALKLMAQKSPAIIVTDLDMPVMSGDELIKELKAQPQTANIPIIVLTGKRSSRPAQERPEAEFVVYKDIDIERQLETAISKLS